MNELSFDERQKLEIDFWKNNKQEGAGVISLEGMVNKFSEFEIFFNEINIHENLFTKSHSILEIGGGSLWASCFLKKKFLDKEIYGSDISPEAINSSDTWESVFNVSLDKKLCLDVAKKFEKGLHVDLIFCYASAHHFIDFESTLKNLRLMLNKQGAIIFLHEPLSNRIFYKFAKRRVNQKRPEVYEDLLRPHVLKKAALTNELDIDIKIHPSTLNRKGVASVYYYLLSRIKFLNKILPTSVCVVFLLKNNG